MEILSDISQWFEVTSTCEIVVQTMIIISGLATTYLTASKSRFAPIVILLAQPFWFITSYTHGQWGIFAMTIYYVVVWIRCFPKWWSPKKVGPRVEPKTLEKCA